MGTVSTETIDKIVKALFSIYLLRKDANEAIEIGGIPSFRERTGDGYWIPAEKEAPGLDGLPWETTKVVEACPQLLVVRWVEDWKMG